MKKLLIVLTMALLVMPAVLAVSVGSGIGLNIETEQFPPRVWMCDNRVVYDDATEPGRISEDGQPLLERINNYAFEGEQIHWTVLVMDKNGKEKIEDVFGTVGTSQGENSDNIEVNCVRTGAAHPQGETFPGAEGRDGLLRSCNAKILEERLTTFEPATMSYYDCTLTVETPMSHYGEYWITVEAVDMDGFSGTMDENEYWFLNPEIKLSVEGNLNFQEVRPGTSSYSETLLIGNDADAGSGVLMDMFISGTDFYDSANSGAMCPTTNQLALTNFRYFATSGAYSTQNDMENDDVDNDRDRDAEGYVNIDYGLGFNDPDPFYDNMEILQAGGSEGPSETNTLRYYPANVLAPGAEMAITFKLDLPEPCNGNFDSGKIFFWGEAI